ncbi:hypothetical protein [Proteiniborus sp. MB09-C3]|uniref:hypothetical protein n=1 Tax=Proteiniborus sp. MB09-C3 TaxID=3050072 RepID=UPI002552289A|nr:hypothetical protein [Proteiniborus sp. MB09-C3]WIV13203.1 hypothetical protein QO263_05700 [Proteiniborus sp. MB09-C3]
MRASDIKRGTDTIFDVIQKNFNIEDTGYKSMIAELESLAAILKTNQDKNNTIRVREVEELLRNKGQAQLIEDKQMFNRIVDISKNINLEQGKLKQVIRMADDLIFDIKNTRDWLNKYQSIMKRGYYTSQDKLELLGKAILGRAIELCPIDTGLLRTSGSLLIGNGFIVIVFTAPYASYVHENMAVYHPVGQAKFLELALSEFIPNKTTWVETHGKNIVYARIDLAMNVKYKHYD